MLKRLVLFLLIPLLFFACGEGSNEVVDQGPSHEKLSVTVENYVEMDAPVKIRFNQDVIPTSDEAKEILLLQAQEAAAEDESSRSGDIEISQSEIDAYIKNIKAEIEDAVFFLPDLQGSFKWNGRRTLVFNMDKGQLGWGAHLAVNVTPITPYFGDEFKSTSVKRSYQLPRYQAGSKVANWDTVPGAPRFIAPIGNSYFIDEMGDNGYFLLYDQPVDLDLLSDFLMVTGSGPGEPMAFTLSHSSLPVEKYDMMVDPEYVVAIKITEPMEDYQWINLAIPSWTDAKDMRSPEYTKMGVTYRKGFEVREVRYVNQLPSQRLALESEINLQFNTYFDINDLRDAIVIEPSPVEFFVSLRRYNTANISLKLTPGQEYSLFIPSGFSNHLTTPIKEAFNLDFTAQDLVPVLQVPDKAFTMEPGSTRIPLRVRNADKITMRVFDLNDSGAYVRALEAGTGTQDASYRSFVTDEDMTSRFTREASEMEMNMINPFSFDWGRNLEEGFKCIEFTLDGRGSEAGEPIRKLVFANVTNTGITVKLSNDKLVSWFASFSDGTPLENVKFDIIDSRGNKVKSGVARSGGVAVIPFDILKSVREGARLYLVADGKSIMSLREDELSKAWQFNMPGVVNNIIPVKGSIFTERGVYRPGDRVFVKAFAFSEADQNLKIVIRDPRSKEVLNKTFTPDEFGAADFELSLADQAAVGRYDISITNGSSYISGSFKVEEYRVPTFLVSIDAGDADWKNGESVAVKVGAEYYHGGEMGGRNFNWKLSREMAPLHFEHFADYIFQSAANATAIGIVGSGSGTLDGAGYQNVSFIPQHDAGSGRMRYTFETTVTDTDRQAYSSRLSRIVNPADLYIGVKVPAREVIRSGTEITMPLVVVTPEGNPVSGKQIEAKVEFIKYHNTTRAFGGNDAQMFSRMVGQEIDQYSLQSTNGPVDFTFTPRQAGIYRIHFDGRDSQGKAVRTSVYLTVTGDESTAWPRFDIEQIELVQDKASYQVGETAVIVPQSPYKKATGLLTIEQDGILDYKIIEINDNTPEIKIPITASYAPNVFVSLVLVRGREHFDADATGFETGAPGFKIGYSKLIVDPVSQRLDVAINTELDMVSPGQQVTIPLKITDYKDKGVESQLTVMVVDEAVLDMTAYETPDPVGDVYKSLALGVRTGTNWLDLPHSRRQRLEQLFPGGDADDLASRSDLEAILRNLFKSTAYWNPDLRTDANGNARFTFTMPDNLTSYRVMVVAADTKKRFGSNEHMLVSQQPLMVQPVIPRFMYPEDKMTVEAMVFNNTSKSASVKVSAEFEGIQLHSGKSSTHTIPAGKSVQVPFDITAGISGTGTIRFIAESAEHKDAGEYSLPIISPGTSITEVVSQKAVSGQPISVDLPSYYIEGTASAEVALSITELTELKDAVQYLMRYPNGCIEQTTSTAYPLVVLGDLLPVIGVEVNQADLKRFSEAGIERILSFQVGNGGLSYWPGGNQEHAFATAFGCTALIEAKKKGYNVPDSALNGMADYLESVLRQGHISEDIPHGGMADGDSRALFVMTLGRMGRPQPQYINALWEKKDKLTGYGLSFLAIAVKELEGGDQSLLQPILQAIKEEAVKTEAEAYFAGQAKGGWSMDSPLRTHGASLVAYGAAQTDGDMTGKLIEGLLARRQYSLWGNTQENVFGIMGIYEAVGKGGGRGGELPELSLALNNKNIPLTSMEAPDDRVRRVTYTDGEMNVGQGDTVRAVAEGSLSGVFLSLRVSYEIPLENADLSSKSNGFTLERVYEDMNGRKLDLNNIPLGELIKVRVKLNADRHYNYVAIDDKLPAGLEPLNTELETTETIDQGDLSMEVQKTLSVLSYQEIRDHRVAFYVDDMLAGDYEFVYYARATTPGTFLRPPGHVEAMYATDMYADTSAEKVTIK